MRFVDLPVRLPRALYDEAVTAYVEKTAARAQSIYRIGNVHYPGLSDIDLIVIPALPAPDNGEWFSVFRRLSERQRLPFLHDPCVLPEECREAVRFTTHGGRSLLAGRDCLAGIEADASPEARAALLLEGYCNYETFARRRLHKQRAGGRHLIAVASSMRFSLGLLDRQRATQHAPDYASAVDSVRSEFSAGQFDGEQTSRLLWDRYLDALERFRGELGQWLPLGKDESPYDFAVSFLHGRREIPGLESSALEHRRGVVLAHQRRVREFGFRYGDLFYREPYLQRLRRLDGRRPGIRGRVSRVRQWLRERRSRET